MFRIDYQLTHDIDWFFAVRSNNGKEIRIHAASNGGRLPGNLGTVSEIRSLQRSIRALYEEGKGGFILNQNLEIPGNRLDDISDDEFKLYFPEASTLFDNTDYNKYSNSKKAYYWSFARMAKLGFYSFDRDLKTDMYKLIAWPSFEEIDKKEWELPTYLFPQNDSSVFDSIVNKEWNKEFNFIEVLSNSL